MTSCPGCTERNGLPVMLTGGAGGRGGRIQQVPLGVADSSNWQNSGPAARGPPLLRREGRTAATGGSAGVQSYLYSAYRFALTHHGAAGSIKRAAAYQWKKINVLVLSVSDI